MDHENSHKEKNFFNYVMWCMLTYCGKQLLLYNLMHCTSKVNIPCQLYLKNKTNLDLGEGENGDRGKKLGFL